MPPARTHRSTVAVTSLVLAVLSRNDPAGDPFSREVPTRG